MQFELEAGKWGEGKQYEPGEDQVCWICAMHSLFLFPAYESFVTQTTNF